MPLMFIAEHIKCIFTLKNIYVYIYIYLERERERERAWGVFLFPPPQSAGLVALASGGL